jgi:hypothetical protein
MRGVRIDRNGERLLPNDGGSKAPRALSRHNRFCATT